MTFNIRFENQADVGNRWEDRRDLVCDVIRSSAPDMVGTQEGTWQQLIYLQSQLAGYVLHAPQRVIDDICQYPTLFYQKNRFDPAGGGDRWLSTTPAIHRSKDWNSAFPRMMSWGRFYDRQAEQYVWVVVTHLDHVNSAARWQQGLLVGEFVKACSGPCIAMGDFNDQPNSRIHQLLTSGEVGLQDTWQVLGRPENELSMTHHGFEGIPQKTRMDWILVSEHFQVKDAHIVRDHLNGQYPSDHYPYTADIEWR